MYSVSQTLLAGNYQIVLISPEMLQSRLFVQYILRNPRFNRRIVSLLIDEAHCISHWGSGFRKKYGTIGIARAFLPQGTPVVAMTATLTIRARRDIMSKLGFIKGTSRFINMGNDRPNVSIIVRACEHPLNSFADLNFIIPLEVTSLSEIPKTWVYVDVISTCEDIVDHLCNVLEERLTSKLEAREIDDTIRSYHAVHTLEYRKKAMEAFREGAMRIMVCTEAAGMVSDLFNVPVHLRGCLHELQGCNIPDVDVVVQWKLPKTLSSWIQRAGRAARGPNRIGIAVLLVEPSVYSVDLETRKPKPTKANAKGIKKTGTQPNLSKPATQKDTKEYAIAHGVQRGGTDKQDSVPKTKPLDLDPEDEDEGLRVLVQNTTCRRKICASVFDSDDISTGTLLTASINLHYSLLGLTATRPSYHRMLRYLQALTLQ